MDLNTGNNNSAPLLLHLGSQQVVLPGFVNLDANPQSPLEIKADVSNLPYDSNSVDMIYCVNLLQVFSHRQVDNVLQEWCRVLKIGGLLILVVPDMEKILLNYHLGKFSWEQVNYYLFGEQKNNYDYHYNGFDAFSIKSHLINAHFRLLEINNLEENNFAEFPVIYVRAAKD
jgi:ubiquinone/menaquinone biosynthesis C-methylase UbiE